MRVEKPATQQAPAFDSDSLRNPASAHARRARTRALFSAAALVAVALGGTACRNETSVPTPAAARGIIDRTAAGADSGAENETSQQPEPEPEPAANRAPWIGGSPPETVLAGGSFAFKPEASDPEGDPLTFAVSRQPPWASFDERDGSLRGAPTAADVGRYENIRISVSDGGRTRDLTFSVEVTAGALGTITVSWVPASDREDGSPLTRIDAHKLYWGPAPQDYPDSVRIENPGITTYVIEGLIPGTYYLAATTVDVNGLESEYSEPVEVTVR